MSFPLTVADGEVFIALKEGTISGQTSRLEL
jgi:hypothetical protein